MTQQELADLVGVSRQTIMQNVWSYNWGLIWL